MTTEPQWQFVGSVGGIADQGVLETVSFCRKPAGDDQLGMPQCLQGGTQALFGHSRGGGEQVVIEITPDTRRDLGHLLDGRQAIQSRRQRIMQLNLTRHAAG